MFTAVRVPLAVFIRLRTAAVQTVVATTSPGPVGFKPETKGLLKTVYPAVIGLFPGEMFRPQDPRRTPLRYSVKCQVCYRLLNAPMAGETPDAETRGRPIAGRFPARHPLSPAAITCRSKLKVKHTPRGTRVVAAYTRPPVCRP